MPAAAKLLQGVDADLAGAVSIEDFGAVSGLIHCRKIRNLILRRDALPLQQAEHPLDLAPVFVLMAVLPGICQLRQPLFHPILFEIGILLPQALQDKRPPV